MIIFPTGSPLQFYVDAVNSGVVTAYGPGLSYGMVNRAATFTVVTKNAGEGKIAFFTIDVCYCAVGLRQYRSHLQNFLPPQVVCHWRWRVPLRPRSPVRTTRMAPALCPTCPRLPETTTSLSSSTTNTFLAVPLLLRSPVRKQMISPVDYFYTVDVYL